MPNESLGDVDRRVFKIRPQPSPVWTRVWEKVILTFSDQQIITGIAILTAGYFKHCTISVYHYQVVLYLAWMSSCTHLTTLTALRQYLRSAPSVRAWRLSGMSILFIMVFVALIPTSAANWSVLVMGRNSPMEAEKRVTGSAVIAAQCFWSTKNWNGWDSYSIFSYFLLLSNYIARAGGLFATSELFLRRWLRDKRGERFREVLDRSARFAVRGSSSRIHLRIVPYFVLLAIYATIKAIYEIYASFIASMTYLLLILGFGTFKVFYPRLQIPAEMASAETY